MSKPPRFNGLKLKAADRKQLLSLHASSKPMKARTWRRIRVLLLLDEGQSVRATARAVGGYPREVSRVGKRYLSRGLEAALTDDPRPRRKRKLDSTQEAAVVAMVCGPPPAGRARWTVTLVTEETVRRGIVDKTNRDTIHKLLTRHELKPWREKNVVRPRD